MQSYSAERGTLPSGDDNTPSFRQVCNQCRSRKIRCDRAQPCSNCITAKRICAFTGAGRKIRPPRQPAARSSRQITKRAIVEGRLANVESLLHNLSQRLAPRPTSNMEPTVSEPAMFHKITETNSGFTTTPTHTPDSDVASLPFVSEPILAEQRTYASNFVQNAIRESPLYDFNIEMQDAMASLQHIVELQNSQSSQEGANFPHELPIPEGGLIEMPMPPLKTVVSIWTRLKASPPTLFTSLCTVVGVTDFPDLCRLVYFPSADFSDSTFAAVNIFLYYMFSEQKDLLDRAGSQEDYEEYIQMCQRNLETGLSNLRVISTMSNGSLVALLLGTLYAIDHSRPAVAWSLNCMAAQICQTRDFHSSAATSTEKQKNLNKKSLSLWHIYTMDSALSLRLGHNPMALEWDTNMPHDEYYFGVVGFASMPRTWVKLACVQRKIHHYLYSVSALSSSSQELTDRAHALVEECRLLEIENIRSRNGAIESLRKVQASSSLSTLVGADEVQLLSTMTLVFRAIPPSNGDIGAFSQECISTARKAMGKHLECMEMLKTQPYLKKSYAHWNLLLLPFTPFFVLFCHVIKTSSEPDLQLVQNFATSLEDLSKISTPMERLWSLCRAMSTVAMRYVEVKKTTGPMHGEFDRYLGQLEFVTGNEMPGQGLWNVSSYNTQAVEINDWFSRSRSVMDLLQQDVSDLGS